MKLFVKLLANTMMLLLISCSSELEEEFPSNGELPVPVHLAIAEVNPLTRAVVNSIGDISFSTLGIYEVMAAQPVLFPGRQLPFSPMRYPAVLMETS